MQSLITVPLYETLGEEAIEFICNQTEMEIIITSGNKVGHFLELKEKCPRIKIVVSMDPLTEEMTKKASEKYSWRKLFHWLLQRRRKDQGGFGC